MQLVSSLFAGSQCDVPRKYDIRVHLSPSVGGVHCIDVAVQLVPKRQPGLGGEIYLGASRQTPCSFTVTAPGRGGGQTWLHILYRNCRWRALSALAPLFAASVEGETLQHFHTHGDKKDKSLLDVRL